MKCQVGQVAPRLATMGTAEDLAATGTGDPRDHMEICQLLANYDRRTDGWATRGVGLAVVVSRHVRVRWRRNQLWPRALRPLEAVLLEASKTAPDSI